MNVGTHQCQNCKNQFSIEPEDVDFYSKIKVPAPTWCPPCRMIRRMVFRNERALSKRKCDLCGKDTIAMYKPETAFPVYCHDCWWSDQWDASNYAREYDFTKPFFQQFSALLQTVPRVALEAYQNQNSPFSNFTWFSKNVYLSSSTMNSENIFNAPASWSSKDIFDAYQTDYSNHCYETINIHRCSKVVYSAQTEGCLDSAFLYDCRNCANCFMSGNLRNKSFVFRNQQLARDEYKHAINGIDFGSASVIDALMDEFSTLRIKSLHRFANTVNAVRSTGDNLTDAKDSYNCFNAETIENVKYAAQMVKIKDSADLYGAGDNGELLYEGTNVGYHDSNVFFCTNSFENEYDLWYSDYCRQSCKNLFGCVGLRKKQYCVLNRQYAPDEYDALVSKIKEQMDALPYSDAQGRIYRFGEFFPPELSPFAYNETIAKNFFPVSKEKARELGYRWQNPENPTRKATVSTGQLPDHIATVKDDILNQTIECAHRGICDHPCTSIFRVTSDELMFHRAMNVSLSRLCLNCRYEMRLAHRNPILLWRRRCLCDYRIYKNTTEHPRHSTGQCPNEFETSYAPGRAEIVYCESCYNAEIA